ncbi:hypothetical protein CQW23_04285 [Capsicum baccatum]|uniref:Cytochrome n=1 Tax=Capsicum baccatum TaxID=33114 RepID=A0A2G2XEB5_CAPBA|nr:hypothetical protein CQW23_04285 [Capsicum baccatum]
MILLKLIYSVIYIPWKLEKHFRKQGIKGPGYRLIYENSKQIKRYISEAESKSVLFNHNVLHRIAPAYYNWSDIYGKTYLYWFGSKPRLTISDPDMIKGLFMNKVVDKIEHDPHAKQLYGQGLIDLRENEEKEEFELDVFKELNDLSPEVISRIVFGSSFEEGKRIFVLQEQRASLVLQAIRSIYVPGLRYLPTKNNMMMRRLEKETRESVRTLIERSSKGRENSKNLLSLLISASEKEREFGVEEIINECKTFYFAGNEANTALLTWTLLLLKLEKKFFEFVRVSMILNETLRLYPPVAALTRETSEDIKLGYLEIPANTQFYVSVAAVHHDTEIWWKDARDSTL